MALMMAKKAEKAKRAMKANGEAMTKGTLAIDAVATPANTTMATPVTMAAPMKVQETVEMPQEQYINCVVDEPGVKQRQESSVQEAQKTVEMPQAQYNDRVGDVPMVGQKGQKTVEVPQVQNNVRVVDVPDVMQRQAPPVQKVVREIMQEVSVQKAQKFVEVPQAQYNVKIVDEPVAMQRQHQ